MADPGAAGLGRPGPSVTDAVRFELELAYRAAQRRKISVVGTDLVLGPTIRTLPRHWFAKAGMPGAYDPAWSQPKAGSVDATDGDDTVALGDELPFAVAALFREVQWDTRSRRRAARPRPWFSRAVAVAVAEAIAQAEALGVIRVNPTHLLLGLLAGPDNRATQLVRAAGGDITAIRQAVLELPQAHTRVALNNFMLKLVVGMAGGDVSGAGSWVAKLMRFDTRRAHRRFLRRGEGYGGPLLDYIEAQVLLLAVRFGLPRTTAAHLILAVLVVADQLAKMGLDLPHAVARYNTAAAILDAAGVTVATAFEGTAELVSTELDDETGAPDPTEPPWKRTPSADPVTHGRTALNAFHRAATMACQFGHSETGTTHVLASALDNTTGPAARLLIALDIDPLAVRSTALHELEMIRPEQR